MSLLKFIFSKSFLKQIGLAIVAFIVIVFLLLQWLKSSTNHNEFVQVPDVSNLTFIEAKSKLEENSLNVEIMDTANFNPKYPKFAVIEQLPLAGEQVKEGRRVYLTINPSGYRKVTVPNIIQITRRSAEATLRAVGLEVGKVEYIDQIGRDMVYYIKYDGKQIRPGEMVTKTSKIDLVLGNGRRSN
ncbi:PASTA domain-containing protein [Sungkyunkwania multivorans]|uniref:PASTA domain-containing protein n=1 Tax=Sungkyunkwania multivorans TaxID=1173618 RepID=A0ABW3CZF7_9FLAO